MPRMSHSRRPIQRPSPACTVTVTPLVDVHAPGWEIDVRPDPVTGALRLCVGHWDQDPDPVAHGRIIPLACTDGRLVIDWLDVHTVRALGTALLAAADHLPESAHVPRGAAHDD